MPWDRLSAGLVAADVFLAGVWAQSIADVPYAKLALLPAIITVALVAAALRTSVATERWPALLPARSRLARLWNRTTAERGQLKRAQRAGTISRDEWEPRLRAFEEAFWAEIGRIQRDDAPILQTRTNGLAVYGDPRNLGVPRDWADGMLKYLEDRRLLIEDLMGKRYRGRS
jgi:hypothetical protein